MHQPPSLAVLSLITFWMFITIVSVAGILFDYRKKRLTAETLRLAIEHSQSVDPALLERVFQQERVSQSQEQVPDPRLLKIGGIITVSSGVGVFALSFFVAQVAAIAFYPIMGAGVLTVCVGIGLLIAARVLAHEPRPGSPTDRGA